MNKMHLVLDGDKYYREKLNKGDGSLVLCKK